ncbi:arsenite efflux pump ACR3 and related permeases [Candidatus Brocadia sinica JPN1]|uniref:Arsenite efflux pump ACR3 and related permeases n=1 Tax=Candidatus Brocadia sinica JPN1 TaxID=1197129 RepID=A0ABQ0K0H3_9BACT|nr:arsenite efflux pump ACR3 and related permeases [Candidatus Brocadia sinica JPN1]
MPLSEILIAELGRVPEDVQNILLSLKDVWIKSL